MKKNLNPLTINNSFLKMTSAISTSDIMFKNPVTASSETSVKEIARLMKNRSIESVILVENKKPFGIVTERDLVWRVVALGKDPGLLRASDVCSKPVFTVSENESIEEAIELMKEHGIIRLAVVDEEGEIDRLEYFYKHTKESLVNSDLHVKLC